MKKGLHKSKKVCYDNPRWETGVIFGPVAQLGERTVRIRKVESSILFVSTILLKQWMPLAFCQWHPLFLGSLKLIFFVW